MPVREWRGVIVALAALTGFVSGSVPAQAGDPLPPYVAAAAYSGGVGYINEVVATAAGEGISVAVADIIQHDVVADDFGSDDNPWCDDINPLTGERRYPLGKCPLFWSPLINATPGTGGPAQFVQGTDTVAAGTYAFHCSIHADMTGTLVVLPSA